MDDNNSENQSGGFGELKEREELGTDDESTQDEQLDGDQGDQGEGDQGEADNQQNQGENDQDQEDQNQETPQKTEKGTNLDKNPKSAVHQQLANEKKIRGQYEEVLASPALMQRYLREQFNIDVDLTRKPATETKTETTPTERKKWTAQDFESREDVADKFNQLEDKFEKTMADKDKEISDLKQQLGGMSQRDQLIQIADSIESDVKALRGEPELNPESPEYIPGLEEKIGGMFKRLDFDKETGSYRGKYSILELGQEIIDTARAAKKAGVQRGQTIVKDKSKGNIRTTSTVDKQVDGDKLTPSQSIAQGVAKMFK